MIITGKAVLVLGILSVFGAAAQNHHRLPAQAAAPIEMPAAEVQPGTPPATRPSLPPIYWTAPSTSPLQGVGTGLIRAAEPLSGSAAMRPATVALLRSTASLPGTDPRDGD